MVARGADAAAVASAAVTLAPYGSGVTVDVLREGVTGRDQFGNDIRAETATPYSACASWPQSTTEDPQGRTTVTTGRVLLLPDGAVIGASDKVRYDDGSVWRVQGDPQQHQSAITGARGGVLVNLQRVTG